MLSEKLELDLRITSKYSGEMEDKENTHKNPIEIFTSLDLEMNQPSRKIIQIGACAGNILTGEILEKFSVFVNPQEQLAPFIVKLTGIKQEDVDAGIPLDEAYKKLAEFHKKHKSFVNPITWGGGDSQEIYQQLERESRVPKRGFKRFMQFIKSLFAKTEPSTAPDSWCFGRRWIDAKTLFVSWRFANGKPIQGGLAKSMLKVGLKFEGRKHNATDDAVNTFRMYVKMLDLLKDDV